MCLLIAQRTGAARIPEAHLRDGWKANSDGAGYAFTDSGKLIVRRFPKLRAFLRSYASDHAAHGATSPFVVHLRYATHGGVSPENTHPFTIAAGAVAFAHNGILSDYSPARGESDTRFFARTVLAYRSPDQLLSDEFGAWLGKLIGTSNKLAFVDASGRLSIVNESMGSWIGETWYSNGSYLPAVSLSSLFGRSYGACGAGTGRDAWADELETFGETMTDGEAYALGFDAATNRSASVDPDYLSDSAWRAYRDGLRDGAIDTYGRSTADELERWELSRE